MRRFVGALVLCAMLAALIPATAGAQQGVSATVGQFALATDMLRVDGKLYMYVGGAHRATTSKGTVVTRGFAARGRCFVFKKRDFKITICIASAPSRKVSEDDFDFDPALRSARLALKNRDGLTRLRWTGRGDPEPGFGPAADPSYGAFAWTAFYRDAKARGTILGQRVAFRGFNAWSFLEEGADVFATPYGRTSVWQDANGTINVRSVRRERI